MGQKINPKAFRIGNLYTWSSRWFANSKNYKDLLLQDVKIRKNLMARLKLAGIAQVEIERSINKIDITIHVSRPGVVIGRGGSGLEEVKKFLAGIMAPEKEEGKDKTPSRLKLEIKVEPVKEPNLDAYLVATNIADQLAKRLPQRRVAKVTMERVMTAGAKGVKIVLAGRIGGAEICRRETFKTGMMPLSTLREDIDFASLPCLTRSGYVGVKVWICKKT